MARRWLRVALAVAGVGVVVWLVARDADSLDALRSLSAAHVGWILALQVAYLVVESVRMEVVVEHTSRTALPSMWWLRVFLVGRVVNMVVPQSGNVYRAVSLKRERGVGYATFGGGIGAFLWLTITLNLALATVLVAWRPPATDLVGLPPWLGLGIAATVVAVSPLLVRVLLGLVRSDHRLVRSLRTVLDTITGGLDAPLLARFAGVWALTLAVVLALYDAVLDAADTSLGPGEVVALYALVQVTSFVVVTPGNLGIQELGFAGLAGLFGVPIAHGATAAAIIRATGLVALFALSLATSHGTLRRAVREARVGDPRPEM